MKTTLSYTATGNTVIIEIGEGLIAELPSMINDRTREVVVISDATCAHLFGEKIVRSFLESHYTAHLVSFPSGEKYKTRHTKEEIEDQLFEKGVGKNGCIIAVGGGVVTDLAGFVAATYCRGIPYISVPTTLLGMIDASIGGKTGVDLPIGKNLIGAIYQPKKIVMDLLTLKQLPAKEFSYGLVEAIKHALIADEDYFAFIEHNSEGIRSGCVSLIHPLVAESVRIKSAIVAEDEKEEGKRRVLNFGHTVGHALEQLSNYQMPHGEAVALGLLAEIHCGMHMGILSYELLERVKRLLRQFVHPLRLPFKGSQDAFVEACFSAMRTDKKSFLGKPRFVMIEKIGSPLPFEGAYCNIIDDAILIKSLQWLYTALT